MQTKYLYYRGEVRITSELKERILKVFGGEEVGKTYNHFAMLPYFSDSGSCFWRINELMLTIQTNKHLNCREKEIEARIAKGLTRSRGRLYEFVEMHLLDDLYVDAISEYNKVADERIQYLRGYELNELYELYNIKPTTFPYLNALEAAEAKIALIQEPKKILPFTLYKFNIAKKYGEDGRIWSWENQTNAIKSYNIQVEAGWIYDFEKNIKPIYSELPYVKKVWLSSTFKKCLTITVFDNADSDRAFQNVLTWIKKNQIVKLA